MKKLFYLVLVISLLFSSCTKVEPDLPSHQLDTDIGTNTTCTTTTTTEEENLSVFGTWVLVGAKLYSENLGTHNKTVYDHFSSTQSESSLRFVGSLFAFENIELNVTTWTFIAPPGGGAGVGQFILNGDYDDPYGFNISAHYWTIIEDPTSSINGPITVKLGGSARPLKARIADYAEEEVYFYVELAYDGDNNIQYFTELRFKKQ